MPLGNNTSIENEYQVPVEDLVFSSKLQYYPLVSVKTPSDLECLFPFVQPSHDQKFVKCIFEHPTLIDGPIVATRNVTVYGE